MREWEEEEVFGMAGLEWRGSPLCLMIGACPRLHFHRRCRFHPRASFWGPSSSIPVWERRGCSFPEMQVVGPGRLDRGESLQSSKE